MSFLGRSVLLLSVMVLIAAASAKAEEGETPFNASSADISSVLDKVYFNYQTTYHGQSIQNLSAHQTVDTTGKQSKSSIVNLDSDSTEAYKITDSIGVGAYVPFILYPIGQNFAIGDVGPKIYDNHIVLAEGLTATANLMVQLPTSDYSKARGMDIAFKTTPGIRYAFANSNFSIAAYNEIKEYAGVVFGKTFKLWTLPTLNYKLMKNLSLNLAYEFEWDHFAKDSPMKLSPFTADIQPGFVWNISSTVFINPFLQFFTNNQLSADHAAVGAFFSMSTL